MVNKKIRELIKEVYIDLRDKISEVGRQIENIEHAKCILKEAEEKQAHYTAVESKYRDMCSEWERTEKEYNEELEKNDALEKDLYYERQKTEKYLEQIGKLQDELAAAAETKKKLESMITSLNEQVGTLNGIIVRSLGGENG